MSWIESKWVVDSVLSKIGRPPNNMREFSAFVCMKNSIGLKFLEPEDSYVNGSLVCSVGGVMIRMSDIDYPTNINEGKLVIDNKNLGAYQNKMFIVDGLTEGKQYYFSAFPYSTQGGYNLSSYHSNRTTATTIDSEVVIINITIDDASAFNSTTVSCVNETDPAETKSVTITATQNTATFSVPVGNTYHIEYGEVDDYSKPDNTVAKVATAGETTTHEVTYYHGKIYGIVRNLASSSPEWVRTDDAVGKTATASVGMVAGASDFDTCEPWSGIKRETLSTGDVMVKIPKFYYMRYVDDNKEYIKISNRTAPGFLIHPLFYHANVETDCAYVGAYKTSSHNKSVSRAAPQVSQTRATFRTNAKSKGAGWSLIDIAAVSAIQMLILVEFATNDVQTAIGRGYCDGNSFALETGTCDSVPNLTGRFYGTNGQTDAVWRGIEGFWGNVWEFVDGINYKKSDSRCYVCNNPASYADDTAGNYQPIGFVTPASTRGSYITKIGVDTGFNNHVMFPVDVTSGSSSTYYCDYYWAGSTSSSTSSPAWFVFQRGGYWGDGSRAGLFAAVLDDASSFSAPYVGSRLLYIPS